LGLQEEIINILIFSRCLPEDISGKKAIGAGKNTDFL
jgi:hypothetical protein